MRLAKLNPASYFYFAIEYGTHFFDVKKIVLGIIEYIFFPQTGLEMIGYGNLFHACIN
jgi:hypothetical protein